MKKLFYSSSVLLLSVSGAWSAAGELGTLTPITISAKPQPSSTLTTPASVTVVEGRQLDRQKGQAIMSSIENEAGVHVIQQGTSVAKPVIRGLSGQSIVVVEDGVRSEALQWGNEHGPDIDPIAVERIEILRGANSLLYGSDALGGVISVSHAELPNARLGAGAFAGKAVADVQSVNKSVGHGLTLSGAQGDWGWRTNLSQRSAGNYRAPGQGEIPNTGSKEIGGNGEVGIRKDWGSLAVEYGRFDRRLELQNPGAPGYPSAPLNKQVYQLIRHDNAVVRADVMTQPARLEMIAGFDRANRAEVDAPASPDAVPELHWIQTNYTLDLKAHHAAVGPVQGTIGVSGRRRVEESLGVKHLTPGYNENAFGEYVYEEAALGKLTLSAGVRADQTRYNVGRDELVGAATIPTPVAKQKLNFDAVTGAVGAVYRVTEPLAFAVNVGRGFRNPVPFELFAFGQHEGENVFLIGGSGLKPETSLNTDASIRWASEKVKAEVGVFRNHIQNYIYGTYLPEADATVAALRGAGVTDPVVRTVQNKATIQGVDFAASVAACERLTLRASGSLARGYNDNYGDNTLPNHNLPHVPGDHMKIGAEIHARRLAAMHNPYFGADAKLVRPQRRTGPGDLETPGYALAGLRLGTEFLSGVNRVAVDAGVDNLLDKGYIDYNSLVKFSNIRNPGRNVYVRVAVPFGS
jgi:iron complex outermembrane recepter protein